MTPIPEKPEVWVTGAGVISALGSGVESLRAAVLESRSGLGRRSFFSGQVPDPVMCGMAPDEAIGAGFDESAADRANRLLDGALGQALRSAGLSGNRVEAECIVGTTSGNISGATRYYEALRRGEKAEASLVRYFLPCSPIQNVAERYGIVGRRTTVSSACGSSMAAIGYAFESLRTGRATRVIAGGFEAVSPYIVAGFNTLRLLSTNECKAFDKDRDGLNPGEAAAVLVLETRESAEKRNAPVLGRISGFGEMLEAYHHTRSHPEGVGLVAAMRQALAAAGLQAGAIDHLHLHGTATPANDLSEYHACRTVFGDELPRIPACSTKSRVGHTFGAAGALNALFSLITMETGVVPATMFHREPDPEFAGLSVSPAMRKIDKAEYVLTTALGFGGESFALVLSRAGVRP